MLLVVTVFVLLFLPTSSHEILKYMIEEKLPVNTLIADLFKDLNINSNGFFQLYELLPLNRNLLSVHNQTGHLTINSILDREQMCVKEQCSFNSCEIIFQLSITLEDRILYKIVEIKIKDRNDHSPNFDKQSMIHFIHIKENAPLGHRIILPSANDPDEGLNSIQRYRVDGPGADDFEVDFSSGDIPYLIVHSPLDHQRLSSYSLTLTALDNGEPKRSSTIQLDIRVLNSNDSVPVFLQSVYNIDLREDTVIGITVLKVEATSDNHGKIFYELLTESPFLIDHLTGRIQLSKTLDYEREKSYRLTVKAHENSMHTYASIFIRVLDVNDNPVSMRVKVEGAAILQQNQNDRIILSVEENTPVGTIIGHVILNDLDSSANAKPYLELRKNEPSLPLIHKSIYQNNFQNIKLFSLVLNQNINRESKSLYNNIQLIAHDSGTPSLRTQVYLMLNVTDVNDCTPTFTTNTSVYHIYENNPIGHVIDKLLAHDCDIGQNAEIEYRLLNETDLVIINAQTGELVLNRSIDFELLNTHQEKNITMIDLEFYVEAQDHGQPSLSSQTKVTLVIHDSNDHVPEFDKNQSFNWTYPQSSIQPGSVLGRIYAYDRDSGLQGLLHYSIRSFHPCLTLAITSLGYIYVPHKSSVLTCSFSSYMFEVTVSDYDPKDARSTSQSLIINIDSSVVNRDKPPRLLPLVDQRLTIDISTLGKISFVLDLSKSKNPTYQPRVHFNNANLLSCWNISSAGEISLISHPYAPSYRLMLFIIDELTHDNYSIKLQIDICNSSIFNSCQSLLLSNHRPELFYALTLALLITIMCIVIFSIITCLCCRTKKYKNDIQSSVHQHSFLQCSEDYNSDKAESSSSDRLKSSSNSTIRDDDHDSACIINGHSSSSTSSSVRNDPWFYQKEASIQMYPSSSMNHYDLKLAELLRKSQRLPCVHLNELPPIPQSLSTDYGFSSLELSASSSTSTLPNTHVDLFIDQSPEKQLNLKSFISPRECVV